MTTGTLPPSIRCGTCHGYRKLLTSDIYLNHHFIWGLYHHGYVSRKNCSPNDRVTELRLVANSYCNIHRYGNRIWLRQLGGLQAKPCGTTTIAVPCFNYPE
jgi:hypothetical protein